MCSKNYLKLIGSRINNFNHAMKYSWAFIKSTRNFFNELMLLNIFSQNLRVGKTELGDVEYVSEAMVSVSEEMAATHCSWPSDLLKLHERRFSAFRNDPGSPIPAHRTWQQWQGYLCRWRALLLFKTHILIPRAGEPLMCFSQSRWRPLWAPGGSKNLEQELHLLVPVMYAGAKVERPGFVTCKSSTRSVGTAAWNVSFSLF